jgi:hypothetical protein
MARANTAVGVSPETFLLLLLQAQDVYHDEQGRTRGSAPQSGLRKNLASVEFRSTWLGLALTLNAAQTPHGCYHEASNVRPADFAALGRINVRQRLSSDVTLQDRATAPLPWRVCVLFDTPALMD